MLAVALATIGRQSSDILTIVSAVLGVLGSLYLSYDLLGRPGGFLRRITRLLTLGAVLFATTGILAVLARPGLCTVLQCGPQIITEGVAIAILNGQVLL